jgi:hypothetical protein
MRSHDLPNPRLSRSVNPREDQQLVQIPIVGFCHRFVTGPAKPRATKTTERDDRSAERPVEQLVRVERRRGKPPATAVCDYGSEGCEFESARAR